MTFTERHDEYLKMIEAALADCFSSNRCGVSYKGLLESMNYSLMAGGKRIRPMLVLEFSRICGGDIEKTLPVACAVELLHTYSLIHDDLPCMDNDDLRRGKPTNHKVYGECTAVLAGDALQAEAFGKILRSDLPAENRASCAEALADAAGIDGICGGQYLDMLFENISCTEEQLTDMQSRKTGSLLVAACRMGVLAAGGDEAKQDAAMLYGAALGSAFQIRDDMLDELSTEEKLGKPIGSDKAEGKTTFMTLYGQEKCSEMVEKLTNYAIDAVKKIPDSEFLQQLASTLCGRDS
jgi:geranylgeranyl diphosphate synthase type II